jgi:hypothetical protein
MNALIVVLDPGVPVCSANWTHRRCMNMFLGFLVVSVEEMWFWREMARIDSLLYLYGAFLCFDQWMSCRFL